MIRAKLAGPRDQSLVATKLCQANVKSAASSETLLMPNVPQVRRNPESTQKPTPHQIAVRPLRALIRAQELIISEYAAA